MKQSEIKANKIYTNRKGLFLRVNQINFPQVIAHNPACKAPELYVQFSRVVQQADLSWKEIEQNIAPYPMVSLKWFAKFAKMEVNEEEKQSR